jgi:2-oxoglutarate dehydrogenase E1 component
MGNLKTQGLGKFEVHDSLLSEYAALGFEYGYSVESPDSLVVWEAQFGDFTNGAQIIIDNFLVAAEDKWGQHSGLVLLLPHGYEGQGPEHSSARIERFLTLSASDNIRVTQPTTAAQYFHLLRSQVRGVNRRPLVVFTPKSLLRARQSRSPITELASGSFLTVLDDPQFEGQSAAEVKRVILCSGKVAYDAIGRRAQLVAGAEGLPTPGVDPSRVAVVRVEQLYPWPETSVKAVLARYPSAEQFYWLQEEPENMGPWGSVQFRLISGGLGNISLAHVTRAESASPASGSAALHQLELDDMLERVFR